MSLRTGCSQQKTDLDSLLEVYQYLKNEPALSARFKITPTSNHRIIDYDALFSLGNTKKQDLEKIPSLLLEYLRAGVGVYGGPVWGRSFGCMDLFTVLDFNEISGPFQRRFLEARSHPIAS
ncbi:MAG: hypothetical protein CMP10_05385 [Zetaproteobacteria bacterium]|nr:hypothetical protein [Pseudobdellovibrionaceae bacterium]